MTYVSAKEDGEEEEEKEEEQQHQQKEYTVITKGEENPFTNTPKAF